jgi:4-diphosphocytidyl-2-C-methyl-D-erythritol kinase
VTVLTVPAPAKLNLTLEVLRRRPDGFHEIRSVFQTVSLYDNLRLQSARGIAFKCDLPGWSAERSLVSRAVRMLQVATGRPAGAEIEINKRIPLLSGLGGDSSDAAATLRGLNELWELGLSVNKLRGMAAQLGSDVAFFLYGGTALAGGRGEIITPLPPLAHRWVVLVIPDMPREAGKTGRMYAALRPAHYTDGRLTEGFIKARKEGRFEPWLFNTFENVAFELLPGLKVYKEHLIKLGAPEIHLAGSGPALFTMLEDEAQAGDLHSRCQGQGMRAYLVETLSP